MGYRLLRLELGELRLGFDLALTGFDLKELSGCSDKTEGLTDPDDTPEPPANPVSAGRSMDPGRAPAAVRRCHGRDGPACSTAQPHLMASDPPYGVNYDPAGATRPRALGWGLERPVRSWSSNDARADWREAWALFPGDVAYVWHAGLHARTVVESLEASGFKLRSQIIWDKSRLVIGRGDYHWQHEPCCMRCARRATIPVSAADNALADRAPKVRDRPRHAEAGRVHAPADREQLLAGPCDLRAFLWQRNDDHRGRAVWTLVPGDRAFTEICGCRDKALAGLHRSQGDARRRRSMLR